ncbi:Aste57867_19136 [Aphanomyces stellatus]|uniref:Ubiquitin-like modifier-activating enzyme 5 n=1 Tax=Aphanomyces stellatus TaxID=120398 RepID=A0A485LDJ9_9STRA|nr:hypothetical protein As57867_019072 [Aphanomyces stellatus]VFT95859.1 Aste57867_19136 [Aphanomyces stellatus]
MGDKSHEDTLHEHVAQRVDRLRLSVTELIHGTHSNVVVDLRIAAARILKGSDHPLRPDPTGGPLEDREGPQSRMMANNDRGVIKDVDRLQDMSIVVVGLNGMGCMIAETFCRSGIGKIYLCDNTAVFKADLGRMFFQPEHVGFSRMGELDNALRLINHTVLVEQLHVDLFDTDECNELKDSLFHTPTKPHLVFLCVDDPPLTGYFNALGLECDVPVVHATMGYEGLSGHVVTSIRGKTRCLVCYRTPMLVLPRRSLPETNAPAKRALPVLPASSPALPMFESIVAGIAAHNALKHLLGFGTVSPYIRYSGLDETFETEPSVARGAPRTPPVTCSSALCRQYNDALYKHKGRK